MSYERCPGFGQSAGWVTKWWTVGPVGRPRQGLCRVCGLEFSINGSGKIGRHKRRPYLEEETVMPRTTIQLIHELSITAPAVAGAITLDELEEYCKKAREVGVAGTRGLDITITPGYSDPRESSPGSVKITARP